MFSFHSKYFVYRELKRASRILRFCFKCPDTGQHTVYPGYVLKGEVHHSMRGFKEEERSVLVSVTLMKGITGFKELREKP